MRPLRIIPVDSLGCSIGGELGTQAISACSIHACFIDACTVNACSFNACTVNACSIDARAIDLIAIASSMFWIDDAQPLPRLGCKRCKILGKDTVFLVIPVYRVLNLGEISDSSCIYPALTLDLRGFHHHNRRNDSR